MRQFKSKMKEIHKVKDSPWRVSPYALDVAGCSAGFLIILFLLAVCLACIAVGIIVLEAIGLF